MNLPSRFPGLPQQVQLDSGLVPSLAFEAAETDSDKDSSQALLLEFISTVVPKAAHELLKKFSGDNSTPQYLCVSFKSAGLSPKGSPFTSSQRPLILPFFRKPTTTVEAIFCLQQRCKTRVRRRQGLLVRKSRFKIKLHPLQILFRFSLSLESASLNDSRRRFLRADSIRRGTGRN